MTVCYFMHLHITYSLVVVGGGVGGEGNSQRLEYGCAIFLRVQFWLENKFLGLFYSL